MVLFLFNVFSSGVMLDALFQSPDDQCGLCYIFVSLVNILNLSSILLSIWKVVMAVYCCSVLVHQFYRWCHFCIYF